VYSRRSTGREKVMCKKVFVSRRGGKKCEGARGVRSRGYLVWALRWEEMRGGRSVGVRFNRALSNSKVEWRVKVLRLEQLQPVFPSSTTHFVS
jgi:hypothetical protein